jgi:putative salt-induced outer membrane protein YdiY
MNLKKSLIPFLLLIAAAAAAPPALAQTDAPAATLPPCKCPCPCPEPPPPPLTGSLGAGLSMTNGNSDTSAFNLAFGLVYDPKTHNLFKADAFYLRSTNDGVATADKAAAALRYEYKVSDRVYAFGQVAYLRDQFKNITYLITPMAGAGYYVVKQKTLELSLDGSVGGAFEKDSGFDASSSGAFAVGEAFLWKFSPSAALTQKASGLWKTSNTSDSFYHFELGLAATLTKSFDLKVSYLVDYKNKPMSPDPAVELKKTDTALIAAIIYKF